VVRTNWRSADANKAIPGPWIGRTIFYRIGMVPDQLPTSSVTPVIKVNTKTKDIMDTMEKQITKAINKANAKRQEQIMEKPEVKYYANVALKQEIELTNEDTIVEEMIFENTGKNAQKHRQKNDSFSCPYLGLVTRQIHPGSPEFRSPGCKEALDSELSKLRSRGVWDETTVREWSQVVADAVGTSDTPMYGDLFAIMGQKNAELNIPACKEAPYKARVVFGGHNIRTATGESAHDLFQEVATTPSTMASARVALGIGALRGYKASIRDAEKAYIQSFIKQPGRNSTWVALPKDWWPPDWFHKDGTPKYKKPVVELIRSLYGHPESGALWDNYLKKHLKDLGWKPVDNNPGVWFHIASKAVLVVYVDDLLLVADPRVSDKLWDEIGKVIDFQDPAAPIVRYLGTYHDYRQENKDTKLKTQMKKFLEDAAKVYMEEIGVKSLAKVDTPYLDEKFSEPDGSGKQNNTAASHLMKILFAARMCRPDLTVAITKLASCVSRWTAEHDKHLKRLMAYVAHHTDLELNYHLSTQDLDTVVLSFSPDADLAGDVSSSKSVSGMWLELESADGKRSWPIAWSSKKQTATSSSTCESEVVSMSTGLRKEAIPVLDFIEMALGRSVKMVCKEDNSQAIIAAQKGYSPALRHLARHHRISVGFINEFFHPPETDQYTPVIIYQETNEHKGDFMTKSLDRVKFQRALDMINLRKPNT